MEIIRPRTLSGFMELLPGKQAQFERMLTILRNTYSSYGFAALDTPVIEDAQILILFCKVGRGLAPAICFDT